MRLAFWQRRVPAGPVAPPSKWDRWLRWGRIAALVGALLLLLGSFIPFAMDATAPNEGGDISITVEFYTAFERGGGFVTWDFSPAASNTLRDRVDYNRDGNVSDGEVFGYSGSIDTILTQDVLVLRNFELAGVRIDTQSGLVGEPVDSSARAHVRFTFSGQWAQRDADIMLGGDRLATIGFAGNLTPGMTVHERTVLIDGGLASFSGGARIVRVPAGIAAVATGTWTEGTSSLPQVHFSLFSPVDNSLLLLIPLAIAYFIGVAGARREREATGQARVEPFHNALSAGFLLLLVAYFAALPGLVVWGAGVAMGIGALMFAYRVYPADRRPEEWQPPARKVEEHPGAEEAPGDWAPVGEGAPPSGELAPAMVDPMPLAEMPRAPAGPDSVPTIEPPTREGRPKIVVSSAPRPQVPPPEEPPAVAPDTAPKKIRCPGCKMMFEAAGTRPIHVRCPHCGRRGVLR